jgi:HD-GYP domain-containing protein (c-di-GMP phosphodiesterase class II)
MPSTRDDVRPAYRAALSVEEAIARFLRRSGQQWDPSVVDALLALLISRRWSWTTEPTVADRLDAA